MRAAKQSDIDQLMAWFDSAERTRRWGGPNFDYPFTRESFLRDLKWSAVHSFCLVDEHDVMLGFGQFYERFGRNHLARIAVAPDARGRGHGVVLVNGLIAAADALFPGRDSSLYVYHDNSAAIACYRRAGFTESPSPDEGETFNDCLFMVASNAGS